jgi:hypothetical protein
MMMPSALVELEKEVEYLVRQLVVQVEKRGSVGMFE